LVSSVDRADLLLLVFPLYVDALPFLVTRALEVIADHRRVTHQGLPLRLSVLLNNGFPEAHHNTLALAICHRFSVQSGVRWAGGLAMGAGEALSSGQSLTSRNRSVLPVKHVIQALNMTAAYLAEGQPLPSEAMTMIARSPIPLLPFAAWRWIFVKVGIRRFHRKAAANGISKANMLARPYAE